MDGHLMKPGLHPGFRWLLKGIMVLGIVALFNACTPANTCLTPRTVAFRAGFYRALTDTSLTDSVLGNANILVSNGASFTGINLKQSDAFALSLPQTADSVLLYFQSDSASVEPETIDTISLRYTRQLHFISVACGYETYFTLQSVQTTHQVIDSVLLNRAEVNGDVNQQHVRIVLKN